MIRSVPRLACSPVQSECAYKAPEYPISSASLFELFGINIHSIFATNGNEHTSIFVNVSSRVRVCGAMSMSMSMSMAISIFVSISMPHYWDLGVC